MMRAWNLSPYLLLTILFKQSFVIMGRRLVSRPTISDIERIAHGKAALKRGVGSRSVPHRLNLDEKVAWELAKGKKFVELRGNGWRRTRGDSPLANSYRNYCDALGIPCITLQKWAVEKTTTTSCDKVEVDFSPLRSTDLAAVCKQTIKCAQNFTFVSDIHQDNSLYDNAACGQREESELLFVPIWNIPVCAIEVSFTNRKEAKEYARTLAQVLCS